MSPDNTDINKALLSDAAPLALGNAASRYSQIRGFAVQRFPLHPLQTFRVASLSQTRTTCQSGAGDYNDHS